VWQASVSIASGSQDLPVSAEQMAQGATEQAAGAEEASVSMEEMTSCITQDVDNAQQTERTALRSADAAQEVNHRHHPFEATTGPTAALSRRNIPSSILALPIRLCGLEVRPSSPRAVSPNASRSNSAQGARTEGKGAVPQGPQVGVFQERSGAESS
jgi:hypothetical protein